MIKAETRVEQAPGAERKRVVLDMEMNGDGFDLVEEVATIVANVVAGMGCSGGTADMVFMYSLMGDVMGAALKKIQGTAAMIECREVSGGQPN